MAQRAAVPALTALAAGAAYMLWPAQPVAAEEAKPKKNTRLLRRHSSGDHAFLPTRTETEAKKTAIKAFGVDKNHVQDGEGTRLPTTRGY